jgi:hypothetical protein
VKHATIVIAQSSDCMSFIEDPLTKRPKFREAVAQ